MANIRWQLSFYRLHPKYVIALDHHHHYLFVDSTGNNKYNCDFIFKIKLKNSYPEKKNLESISKKFHGSSKSTVLVGHAITIRKQKQIPQNITKH